MFFFFGSPGTPPPSLSPDDGHVTGPLCRYADWFVTAVRTGKQGAGGISMMLIPRRLSHGALIFFSCPWLGPEKSSGFVTVSLELPEFPPNSGDRR